MTTRVPPSNLDAEAAVLAAVLLDGSLGSYDEVSAILRPEHFYGAGNRLVYEAAIDLVSSGQPPNVVTVATWLQERNRLQAAGGAPYLHQLVDQTPAVSGIAGLARVIFDKHRLRQLIAAAQWTLGEAYNLEDPNVDAFTRDVETRIAAASKDTTRGETGQGIARVLKDCFSVINEKQLGKRAPGLSWGFQSIDEHVGCLVPGEVYVIAGRPGMGKGLAHETRVLTPFGWEQCGNLRVGDRVIGSNGLPTMVTGVFELGPRQMYEVRTSDGGAVEVSGDHLWHTRTHRERQRGACGAIRTTEDMLATVVCGGERRLNHSVPMVHPVRFDEPKEPLPIEPYLLGVWLGDGSKNKTEITNPEEHIQLAVSAALPMGDTCHIAENRGRCRSIVICGSRTRSALRDLGLFTCGSHDRFIPARYLVASINERKALLRGLCDSDGYVCDSHGKSVEVVTTSQLLRDGLKFLVQSLGGRATWTSKLGSYRKDGKVVTCREAYRMIISFPRGDCVPVSSPKHLAKWVGGPLRLQERFVAKITATRTAACRCIKVEADDGLFVTEDFLVTHNTGLVTKLTRTVAAADVADCGVVVASAEMNRAQLGTRLLAQQGVIDTRKVGEGRLDRYELDAAIGAAVELSRLPIFIDDRARPTVTDFRGMLRSGQRHFDQAHPGKRVGLGVIDHLQFMGWGDLPRELRRDPNEALGEIMARLKATAKEWNIPIMVVSHLNRECEKRPNKRPILSDLRASGAIEQDAYAVAFLYRADKYRKPNQGRDGLAELIFAKVRNGHELTITLKYVAPSTEFAELQGCEDFDSYDDEEDLGI